MLIDQHEFLKQTQLNAFTGISSFWSQIERMNFVSVCFRWRSLSTVNLISQQLISKSSSTICSCHWRNLVYSQWVISLILYFWHNWGNKALVMLSSWTVSRGPIGWWYSCHSNFLYILKDHGVSSQFLKHQESCFCHIRRPSKLVRPNQHQLDRGKCSR